MKKKIDPALESGAEETYDADKVRKNKGAGRMTAISAAVVIAVILLNVFISVLGENNLLYLDLSLSKYRSAEAHMYTLSDMCAELVGGEAVPMIERVNAEREKNGEQPLKLKIVFCSDRDIIENDPMMRYVSYTARGLAKEFSECVEVEYINMQKNPSAVQKYKTTSAANIYDSDIIVEFGSEYLVQGVNNFYMTDTGEASPWAYIGEKKLASMILAVTRAEAPICCLTSNHGETLFDSNGEIKEQYSTFIKLIEGAGYVYQIIDLEKEEIPENCRMIITFDPREDFKAFGNLGENGVSEIEKLDKYIDNANAFFYICNSDTPALKNLDEYLVEWGVTVSRQESSDSVLENFEIVDKVNCTDSGKGSIVIGDYATAGMGASLTKDMRERSYPPKVIFGNVTSITPADNYTKFYVDADEETGTEAYSYYSYYRNGNSRSMMDIFVTHSTASAKVGGEVYEIATEYNRFKLMTVTQEYRQVQQDNYSAVNRASYVLALASTDFLSNDVLDSAAYGNTDVVLSVLRNTGNEVIPTDVSLKALYVYEMVDTAAYKSSNPTVWFGCLVVIPAVLALIFGVVINVKRKYR